MARRSPLSPPAVSIHPVDREHYEVASEFTGFFDEAEYRQHYRDRFPHRRPSAIRPERYSFNTDARTRGASPFLWWDEHESYVFVGFDGAPKGFQARTREAPVRRQPGRQVGKGREEDHQQSLDLNLERARDVAQRLYELFLPNGAGIFGEHMSSLGLMPDGMARGSREHLLFLTFTNAMNRRRDALELWQHAIDAWSNPKTRHLFEPAAVIRVGFERLRQELKRLNLSKMGRDDTNAWFQIAQALSSRYDGDPGKLFAACDYHAPTILTRIRAEGDWANGHLQPSFPMLRGNKIAPLWIRTLRDYAGIEFDGMREVPIAVDVHVLRATFCAGALTGRFSGSQKNVFGLVRKVWQEATRDLSRADGRPLAPLDIDGALWTLGRLGCSRRGNGALRMCPSDCPLAGACAPGRIVLQGRRAEIEIPTP